eukprot:CAMPEP_0176357494 /NCGR_PEP_ID=MMETSP0126-20121128/14812_1 /TAXON_ID=141414 ORGANISM="Strombidinopsis acuminatum, Strain SPMC142" /NCGR_SAMPLE_ID=MMETSP0126 /ASSEMBLY_ACC=CAM_ASM_000229 /LENGTH=31 /DNA_ID= /DNA_START= /DNA_END= /DNA_ORIENTATION=
MTVEEMTEMVFNTVEDKPESSSKSDLLRIIE